MREIICFIFGCNYETIFEIYPTKEKLHDFKCKRCEKSMSV